MTTLEPKGISPVMLVSMFFVFFKLDPFIIPFSFFGSIIQLYHPRLERIPSHGANLELIVAAIFGCETTQPFPFPKKNGVVLRL